MPFLSFSHQNIASPLLHELSHLQNQTVDTPNLPSCPTTPNLGIFL
jgi:hypothetical protein